MSSPAPTWNPPPATHRGTVVNSKVMLVAVAILFAVVIFILCLHVYAKWFWRNQASVTIIASDGTVHTLSWRRRRYRGDPRIHHPDNNPASSQSVGLARDVVEALPTFEFSGEEGRKLECAVCLEDFEEGEKGRTLPKCGHDFHLDCVDMWLHSHSTCPLCRTSVAGEDETKQVVLVQVEEPEGAAVVGDVGGAFMAAMRASRRRQRSLSSPTGLNSLPRTGEDQEEVDNREEMVPEIPARETMSQESLKEYETPSVSTVAAESRPTSGIRAPFQVTIDIPRAGGVGLGNSSNVVSPMARASASFRRLLSRGKSVVAPYSDEDGPSSSPRTSSPPPPPPPPPPHV